ncbi:CBS domain-containing protein [Saccharophagus degradans]|uniref:CBS domain protein n=2 Tax=Saccharophagus degradans TaxID=86304 RepID=Q21K07_SACD2|nr:CBS domain-containing protein [Saccharophagus degradans]ABD80972.1 CBS domain protein [Saccharophagus degradans 2-40]MBU2984129.1 CBS domain-containing protein [Saccharophagus degradans]MDO6424212.1 CBS domain-containing protein [Saccharophagus degradans]MDO6608259.1 CBS domain-containing protein [Saccharophagus degradans]WGO96787.1 CBS domain-containing protein [Saccharophagus degradans]
MHSILVRDYMDRNPHAINQLASVREAIGVLVNEGITGAPVIDDSKTLVGFISEHDCIRQLLNDAFYYDESAAIGAIMRTDLKSVTPDTSILTIAEAMANGPPKNYPVVDNGKLVGLISRAHVLRALLTVND